jgi:hypothetical protein
LTTVSLITKPAYGSSHHDQAQQEVLARINDRELEMQVAAQAILQDLNYNDSMEFLSRSVMEPYLYGYNPHTTYLPSTLTGALVRAVKNLVCGRAHLAAYYVAEHRRWADALIDELEYDATRYPFLIRTDVPEWYAPQPGPVESDQDGNVPIQPAGARIEAYSHNLSLANPKLDDIWVLCQHPPDPQCQVKWVTSFDCEHQFHQECLEPWLNHCVRERVNVPRPLCGEGICEQRPTLALDPDELIKPGWAHEHLMDLT